MSFSFFQNQGVIILLEKDLYSWGNFGEVSTDQEAPNLSGKSLIGNPSESRFAANFHSMQSFGVRSISTFRKFSPNKIVQAFFL